MNNYWTYKSILLKVTHLDKNRKGNVRRYLGKQWEQRLELSNIWLKSLAKEGKSISLVIDVMYSRFEAVNLESTIEIIFVVECRLINDIDINLYWLNAVWFFKQLKQLSDDFLIWLVIRQVIICVSRVIDGATNIAISITVWRYRSKVSIDV